MKPGLPPKASASPIYAILGEMKGAVFLLFAVGFIVNLLQLTGSVYMMQVYDRVLASQSEATLLALTLISLFLIAIYGVLEGCRSFALIGLGRLLDRRLSSRVFEALFVQGSLRGSERLGAQPLRDLEQVRSFISTTGLTTGMIVTGLGIPADTTVTIINEVDNTVTISRAVLQSITLE
jgi:ABC-type protease/lipase transport system fused ATPase/permease subunit